MNRRSFLLTLAATVGAQAFQVPNGNGIDALTMTVNGPIKAHDMGFTLSHEHILVDFIGAGQVSRDRYDPDDVFQKLRPYLMEVKARGCDTFIDCTPAYLGRDPELLRRLAEASELQILTNTGYYAASNEQFVPPHAYEQSAEDIAQTWIREWEDGLEGTDIQPGFMKIGVDGGPLSDISRKIVRAAALTHRESGLTIASHTGDAVAALEQLDILQDEGVGSEAFIWVHAQNVSDTAAHVEVAGRGAWVSFDGVGPDTVEQHVEYLLSMKKARQLHRVLVSHDAGWYEVGDSDGGEVRPYTTIMDEFIPSLKHKGTSEAEIDRLFRQNPQDAFAIRKRTVW